MHTVNFIQYVYHKTGNIDIVKLQILTKIIVTNYPRLQIEALIRDYKLKGKALTSDVYYLRDLTFVLGWYIIYVIIIINLYRLFWFD